VQASRRGKRHLRARAEQHFIVCGSRDFESVDVYETWLQSLAEKRTGFARRR